MHKLQYGRSNNVDIMTSQIMCPPPPVISSHRLIFENYKKDLLGSCSTSFYSFNGRYHVFNSSGKSCSCHCACSRKTLQHHGLQSLPPFPKRAERKVRRRPFREAGSGHKQWNTVSCVDTFSIISKFSAQNSKI